tara:strand:- start:1836 stop:2564 length:729 start_codon:yes stop_codon:yes gene_type:complete
MADQDWWNALPNAPKKTMGERKAVAALEGDVLGNVQKAQGIEQARLEALKAKRRRATPEQLKAAGIADTGLSYQIDALGNFYLLPGQPPPKAKVVDLNRPADVQRALEALTRAEDMARNRYFTVGRQAQMLTELPVVGPLINQNRVDFEAENEVIRSALIQDRIAALAKINQGGVTGLANSPLEAARLASSIANLDPNQSLDQYLQQTGRARQYLNRQLPPRITPEQAKAELARRRAAKGPK